jgi:Peptidase C65 Otubain
MDEEGGEEERRVKSTVVLNPTSTNHHQQNTFQQTQAQLDAIEKEIKENQPLTSLLMDVISLQPEYHNKDHSTNDTAPSFFALGIHELAEKYSALRKTRGDGNCYYRSFLYSLSEALLLIPVNADQEKVRILQYGKLILSQQLRMSPPPFLPHGCPLPRNPFSTVVWDRFSPYFV